MENSNYEDTKFIAKKTHGPLDKKVQKGVSAFVLRVLVI